MAKVRATRIFVYGNEIKKVANFLIHSTGADFAPITAVFIATYFLGINSSKACTLASIPAFTDGSGEILNCGL